VWAPPRAFQFFESWVLLGWR